MSLSAIRSALHPHTAAIRRALFGMFGVITIIAGLLTMHTPSVDASHSVPVVPLTSIAHPVDDSAATASEPATDECATTGCEPMHVMSLMACLLAVLLITLTLGAAPMASWWVGLPRSAGRALRVALRAATLPPPSLVALSISRT